MKLVHIKNKAIKKSKIGSSADSSKIESTNDPIIEDEHCELCFNRCQRLDIPLSPFRP